MRRPRLVSTRRVKSEREFRLEAVIRRLLLAMSTNQGVFDAKARAIEILSEGKEGRP